MEVLAGVAGFVIALLTWTLQLFAPLYELNGFCISCHPRYGRVSLVDSVRGLGNFVRYDPGPSYAVLFLAFLVVVGTVAAGAYLHGGRGVAAGRWLVWAGSLLEALLLPVVVFALSDLPLPVTPAMPFEIVPGEDMLTLGLGLCAGLAVIAAVAAMQAESAWRQPGR